MKGENNSEAGLVGRKLMRRKEWADRGGIQWTHFGEWLLSFFFSPLEIAPSSGLHGKQKRRKAECHFVQHNTVPWPLLISPGIDTACKLGQSESL